MYMYDCIVHVVCIVCCLMSIIGVFIGSIPSTIGSLISITYLDMDNNKLIGTYWICAALSLALL